MLRYIFFVYIFWTFGYQWHQWHTNPKILLNGNHYRQVIWTYHLSTVSTNVFFKIHNTVWGLEITCYLLSVLKHLITTFKLHAPFFSICVNFMFCYRCFYNITLTTPLLIHAVIISFSQLQIWHWTFSSTTWWGNW